MTGLPISRVNLCTVCDGRCFLWEDSRIVDAATGEVRATLYKQGHNCTACGGTGCGSEQRAIRFLAHMRNRLIWAIVALFVVIPLLRMIF